MTALPSGRGGKKHSQRALAKQLQRTYQGWCCVRGFAYENKTAEFLWYRTEQKAARDTQVHHTDRIRCLDDTGRTVVLDAYMDIELVPAAAISLDEYEEMVPVIFLPRLAAVESRGCSRVD